MQRSKMKSLFDHLIGALFVPNLTYRNGGSSYSEEPGMEIL
jgi:hypothetical protein